MSDTHANGQDWLKSLPLYLLPHHAISRLVYRASRWRTPLKDPLARWFIRQYGLNMDEALQPDPTRYASFNDLFTRELAPGMRPLDPDPMAVLCPADSRISQFGRVHQGRIIQAKAHDYSVASLLGIDTQAAQAYEGGEFITLYLSPRDYHRVHMPLTAKLKETTYVPGRLFSVAPHTTRTIPGLFARNERLVSVFAHERGQFAQVLVGAINVASIETVWAGEVTPRWKRELEQRDYAEYGLQFERGAEMGRFNLGSTVILVFPPGMIQWRGDLQIGQALKMGEKLAMLKV